MKSVIWVASTKNVTKQERETFRRGRNIKDEQRKKKEEGGRIMEMLFATEAVNEQDFVREPRKSCSVSRQTRLLADFSSERSRDWSNREENREKKNKELREIYAKAVCSDRHRRLTYLFSSLKTVFHLWN